MVSDHLWWRTTYGCRTGTPEDYFLLLEDCLEVGVGLEYRRTSGLDVAVTDATTAHAFRIVQKGECFPALPLVLSKAKEICAHTEFKGFSLDDPRKIARGFHISTRQERD